MSTGYIRTSSAGIPTKIVWEFDIDSLSALENLFWATAWPMSAARTRRHAVDRLVPLFIQDMMEAIDEDSDSIKNRADSTI